MEIRGVEVDWLGHSGFLFDAEPRVVVDPFRVEAGEPVDVALITHPHFDHLSPDDLDRFVGPDTEIVSVADAAGEVEEHWPDATFHVVEPGDEVRVAGLQVEAVPAYNVDKNYHPRSQGWVGYVFELGGTRWYHAGDTDLTPGIDEVEPDVAFLPVSGTYVMDADQAAKAAELLAPATCVPMHYGAVVGTDRDADRFVELIGDRGTRLEVNEGG